MKKIVNILIGSLVIATLLGISVQAYMSRKIADNRQVITFWHSMGGVNKSALEDIIKDYNKSQNKYKVVPNYQGEYAENLAKYQSVAGTDSAPSIVQVQEIGSQTMIDNKRFIPVQDLADKDHTDLSMVEKQIATYYSVNGRLQSVPLNSSVPVLYYNKDLLKKLGYKDYPKTYEEITEVSKKIKESGSKTKGFSLLAYGWYFEELLANQNVLFLNKENGTTGTPTAVAFNNDATRYMMNWTKELIKDKTFVNYGTNWNNLTAGFLNEDVAMVLDSSASARQIFDSAKFDVGIGYIPYPEKRERTGVAVGGASLWVTKDKSQAEIDGSWDFLKFVMKPETQADWSLATGYLPSNVESYKESKLIKAYKKNPELKQPGNELHDTKDVPATQGAKTTIISESRKIIEAGMDSMYHGGDTDKTIDQMSNDINRILTQANMLQGK